MTTTLRRKATAAAMALVILTMATGTAWARGGQLARVQAYSTASWELWGNVGERITVTVQGDGDTDLDLFVYAGDRLVVSDTGPIDVARVTFTVTGSGYFVVKVKNLGSVYNEYTIATSVR